MESARLYCYTHLALSNPFSDRYDPVPIGLPTVPTTGAVEEASAMARQDILDQITQALGAVPDWLAGMPDPQLEHQWGMISWVLSDTVLSARDKALVSFGAAAAVHCPY